MADVKVRFLGDASDLSREIDSIEEEAGGIGDSLAGKFSAAGPMIAGAFAAVGVAAGAAFKEGVGQEASADRIGASLLLSEAETEKLAEIAGASYANGFGESVEAQQEVVRGAIRGGLIDLNDMTVQEAQSIADRLSGIADITGMGVEEVTQAAGSAIRSGLAKDVNEALDLLASLGPSVNFDEAIAATQEYSPFLADLGLGAENWAGAMTSSSQTSIQSIDKTGDALKEFGIIMKEESDEARAALTDLGLDADEMFARVNAGDPTALFEIVDALDQIEDPAKRAQAGVALMGTPFEDLGNSAIPILQDLQGETAALADSEAVVAGAYDNLEGSFTANWRTIKQSVVDAITDTIMPIANGMMSFFVDTLPGALETLRGWWDNIFGGIGETTSGLGETVAGVVEFIQELWDTHAESIIETLTGWGETLGAIFSGVAEVISTIVSSVTDFIQKIWERHGERIMKVAETVWNIIKTVIDTVLGVIRGIIDTVMGIITGDWDRVWNGIKGIVSSIWDGIKGVISGALDILKNIIPVALDVIKGVFSNVWNTISSLVSGAWDDITGFISGGLEDALGFVEDIGGNILNWFQELPGKIGDFFSGLADAISAPFRTAFDAIKNLWNRTAGGFGFSIPSWVPGIGGKEFRIPRMHLGGVFEAMTPGGEGLALLRDGERVLSPGLSRELENRWGMGPVDEVRLAQAIKSALMPLLTQNQMMDLGGGVQPLVVQVMSLEPNVLVEQLQTYQARNGGTIPISVSRS